MIAVFKGQQIQDILDGKCPEGFPSTIMSAARRKIAMVRSAMVLDDLKSPPGNKLHPLEEERKGQHAIWINKKYRVCFVWTNKGATQVEITDYH
jgi:toxin HigB-1